MPPDEPTDEERLQELPQDNETPFQPADPSPNDIGNETVIPDDHPQTDTNLDMTEAYDEGVSGAAETEDTSGQTAVTDYTPPPQDN